MLLEVKLSPIDYRIVKIVSDTDRLTDKLPDKRARTATNGNSNACEC